MKFLIRCFGYLFFHHVDPIVKLGSRKNLGSEDLPELPKELDPRLEIFAERNIDWSSESKLVLSLFWVSRRLWLPTSAMMVVYALCGLLSPLLVHAFLSALETKQEGFEVWFLAALIGVAGICSGLLIQHYYYQILKLYQIFTNILNKKLFSQSVALSKEAREQVPIGDIVNHMSSDSEAVANVGTVLGEILYALLIFVGVAFEMFRYLGATSLVAWGLLIGLVPLTKKVGANFSRLDEVLMRERDERVTLMSQILGAIRMIKYFVWEESIKREVGKVRDRELHARKRLAWAELVATLSYVAVSTLILFVVLLVHTLRGFELSASLVFTCASLFALLEDPFAGLSRQISALTSAWVGARRITMFLARSRADILPELDHTHDAELILQLKGVNFQYRGAQRATLHELDLQIKKGDHVAIVGPVGSGKSSLLLGLLGELPASQGLALARDVRSAFVPQEPYLINASLRENLLLGSVASDQELRAALFRSCLDEDMRLWEAGLDTEIGEKGVNLSGGQKQRLSLARADLQNAELILLDDPLSAVDPLTETKLVQRLLQDIWRDKTCIVTTHRLEPLAHFDRVIFLHDGRILAQGNHAVLLQTNPAYREFLAEHENTKGAELASAASAESLREQDPGQGTSFKITHEEDRSLGAVKGSVYVDYLRYLGGRSRKTQPWVLFGLLAAAFSSSLLPLAQKTWLGFVSNVQTGARPLPRVLGEIGLASWVLIPSRAILLYGAFGVVTLVGVLLSDRFWLKRGLSAGQSMHDQMLDSILGAPIRFFDSTPAGRILQRFSRDLEAIDIQLQWTFEQSVKCFASLAITLALIVSVLPVVTLVMLPILAVYWRCQNLYRRAAREAKRLDSVSRSPRYAHFKETLQGLVVIRAFDRTDWFFEEFYRRLHENQRMFHGHVLINRWFSSRIPVIGGMVAIATCLSVVQSVHAGMLTPGMAGLLTVYSLNFWGVLNWGIRVWADVEARMTSVERVKFMSELPREKQTLFEKRVRSTWPEAGAIEFRHVMARYADDLPLVLRDLSFKIPAGTRVGLIGRTGSGKSTVFQALYRFLELEHGEILIDGENIAGIELSRLRSSIAIIPQDPSLFMGTIRSNLDRFGQFSEDSIWRVLEQTKLAAWVRSLPIGLNTAVLENGHNLSQGQRQLLCLARALLMKVKILILDEATASVDVQTDALVQKLVREECQGMTLLMIAHRLGTVRDCDQVIELSDGRVKRVLFPGQREQKVGSRSAHSEV